MFFKGRAVAAPFNGTALEQFVCDDAPGLNSVPWQRSTGATGHGDNTPDHEP